MKDRAEYAQKNIARGRPLVATTYEHGILIVAENPSRSLHKISEIYDRIAFAGVGKYNEYDQLRVAGVRHADTKGFAFSREDVDARSLANLYAQYLGQRVHPRDEAARGRDPRGRARGRRAARTSCTTSPTRARSPTRSTSPCWAATPRRSPSGSASPGSEGWDLAAALVARGRAPGRSRPDARARGPRGGGPVPPERPAGLPRIADDELAGLLGERGAEPRRRRLGPPSPDSPGGPDPAGA